MSLRPALLSVVAASTFACVADKGAEDDPLIEGKADSFYSPTNHGQLTFGAPNRAEISEAERFHAWTFTLTAAATVSVRTEISNNLDTVMYLYRRDAGSTGSFGSYVEKNDDHGDGIYSQIDFEGEPGEYRVIIKAFKSAQRGPFAVNGSCEGAGCPGPATCVADQFDPLPDSTAKFSAACASDLLAAMTTRTGSEGTVEVPETAVCSLDGLAKRSVDLFRAYWDEVGGWDAFKNGEDDLPLEVTTTTRGTTTTVTIDAPFDEDAITFTYGTAGRLLTLYQHNQSPDIRTFCDQAGTIAAPSEGCVELMRDALVHASAEMTGSGSTTCESAVGQLPPLVDAPVCEFTYKFNLADTAPVSYQYRSWRSDEGLLGTEVTLGSGGNTATYYVGSTHSSTTKIFATKSGATTEFGCYEL